ncbi:MAG: hypothetical protein U1E77_07460 [Inhella sp.]
MAITEMHDGMHHHIRPGAEQEEPQVLTHLGCLAQGELYLLAQHRPQRILMLGLVQQAARFGFACQLGRLVLRHVAAQLAQGLVIGLAARCRAGGQAVHQRLHELHEIGGRGVLGLAVLLGIAGNLLDQLPHRVILAGQHAAVALRGLLHRALQARHHAAHRAVQAGVGQHLLKQARQQGHAGVVPTRLQPRAGQQTLHRGAQGQAGLLARPRRSTALVARLLYTPGADLLRRLGIGGLQHLGRTRAGGPHQGGALHRCQLHGLGHLAEGAGVDRRAGRVLRQAHRFAMRHLQGTRQAHQLAQYPFGLQVHHLDHARDLDLAFGLVLVDQGQIAEAARCGRARSRGGGPPLQLRSRDALPNAHRQITRPARVRGADQDQHRLGGSTVHRRFRQLAHAGRQPLLGHRLGGRPHVVKVALKKFGFRHRDRSGQSARKAPTRTRRRAQSG